MSYGKCSRCGELGTRTVLGGVYTACVCLPCSNEWEAYCLNSSQYVSLYKAEADHQVLGAQLVGGMSMPDAEEKNLKLLAKIVEAKKAMYEFAKEWAGKKVKPKPEDTEE